MANNLGVIIQARLSSSRFPGKIAARLTKDMTVLEYMTSPLQALGLPVVIAFPDTEEHHLFSRSLRLDPVTFFFGSEDNVLDRFVLAAKNSGFTSAVRICGDNPFLNLSFLSDLVKQWNDSLDYLTYFDSAGTPAMKTHYGLFSEIARVSALEEIGKRTAESYYMEHVTPYFYEHPEVFRVGRVDMPEPFWSGVPLRFTLDTEEDLETIRDIVQQVDVQKIDDLIKFCSSGPVLAAMREQIGRNSK